MDYNKIDIIHDKELNKQKVNNEESTNLVQPGRAVNNWCTKMISKGIKPNRQEAKSLQREGQNVANE